MLVFYVNFIRETIYGKYYYIFDSDDNSVEALTESEFKGLSNLRVRLESMQGVQSESCENIFDRAILKMRLSGIFYNKDYAKIILPFKTRVNFNKGYVDARLGVYFTLDSNGIDDDSAYIDVDFNFSVGNTYDRVVSTQIYNFSEYLGADTSMIKWGRGTAFSLTPQMLSYLLNTGDKISAVKVLFPDVCNIDIYAEILARSGIIVEG